MSVSFHPSGSQAGLDDLFYFAKVVAGFKDLSERTHRPITEEIQDRLVNKKQNSAIVIPRDHFKSSIGQATCLWLFTRKALLEDNVEWRTMIDTSTLDLATKHLLWLKSQFAGNETYRSMYGEFYGRGWHFNEKEIFVKQRIKKRFHKEPNFRASGISAESIGLHFDFHWYDDIVSQRNYGTKTMRQKAIDHYISSLQLLDPDGVILYTATRWHDGDLTGWLMKRERENEALEGGVGRRMTFYVRKAIEDGEPLFPERWSAEKLKIKKSSISNFAWQSQWLNDPVLPEYSIPFDHATLYRPRRTFPERLRIKVATVDPAFKEEDRASGDYSVILVGGVDRFNHWWGIDIRMGFWTATQFIDQLFEVYFAWRPDIFKIERKHTSWMDLALRRACVETKINLPYMWIDRDARPKEVRFQNLEPMFVRKQVTFAEEIAEHVKIELEEELERVGVSAHDDILDALSDQFAHSPITRPGADPSEVDTFPGKEGPGRAVLPTGPGGYIPGMMQMTDDFGEPDA